MGRKSTLQYMDSMIDKDGKGDIPSALQVLEKTRKHGTKGWLSKKTGQLFGKIISKKTQLQSQGVENIDDNEIYIEEHGGFDKKGRVLGAGNAAPQIWEHHRRSTGNLFSTPHTPGFVGRVAKENARLKQVEAEQSQRLAAIEEFLSQQGFTTQTCNPGGPSQFSR
ncbi:uncharacterized protein LOC141602437 [Silene latifolia]|uniref:uncharacterized protein LOC141602437 n=1 Tax=Silene latifolia TaxID=37657 RepID=UPI003D77F15C